MQDAAAQFLARWESFYVIVGSSGAALTGLQFVVIALIKDVRKTTSTREIDAFATPTIVHFCAALFVSAVLSAPWHALSSIAYALGVPGVAGVLYTLVVASRASRQTGYSLVLEDWVWHTGMPLVAYGALLGGGIMLSHSSDALFAVAGATILLLFIGIHNAWDTVTYIATQAEVPIGGGAPVVKSRKRRR